MDANQYKRGLEREIELVAQLRDELKVQVHLAKADAKDEWNKLEGRWLSVQDEFKRVSEDTKTPLKELGTSARSVLDELKAGYERVKSNLQR